MKSIAFVNAKGGVGRTTLIYHLAAMFSDLGVRVLAIDLDPQCGLTEMCLRGDAPLHSWPAERGGGTVFDLLKPAISGSGSIGEPRIVEVDSRFGLVAGDLELSALDDVLNSAWDSARSCDREAILKISSFWQAYDTSAKAWNAEIVLIDLSPSLAPLTRAALVGADFLVVPLSVQPLSLQVLSLLGRVLCRWRGEWRAIFDGNDDPDAALPLGEMNAMGYVLMQHAALEATVLQVGQTLTRIRATFDREIAPQHGRKTFDFANSSSLGALKDYRALLPLAIEAHKPMFLLRAADGAFDAHQEAIRLCYQDFRALALTIARKLGMTIPLIEGSAS